MSTFMLEILTPEKRFFKGETESLIVETSAGQLGILANHSPIVVGLQASIIKFKVDGVWREASNGGGFLEVRPDRTIILCETVELPEEIRVNQVKKAIEENERRLNSTKSAAEYKLSKAAISRAITRLKLANK